MNNGDSISLQYHEVMIPNHCKLQFDPFQTQTTTYLRIKFYLLRSFCPHLGSFSVVSSFTMFRPKFYLWPSSGDLP